MSSDVRIRHRSRPRPASKPADKTPGTTSERPSPPGDTAGNYEVGYKKPPRHTQFRPDQSGNARGRPKGSKNLKTEIAQVMNEMVTIREGGKRKRIRKNQVVATRLVNKAMEGKERAILMLLNLADELAADSKGGAATARPDAAQPLEDGDRAILAELATHIREAVGEIDEGDEDGTDDTGQDDEGEEQ